jgi:hypothetical protein
MKATVELRATLPSRITKHESAASFWERVRTALVARERTLRDERHTAKRRVLGRKAVMRVPHTDAPRKVTNRGGLRPCIACLDEDRRILELQALKEFRAAHAVARLSWAAGNRRAKFPFGTYRRVLELGVRCAERPSLN